MGVGDPTHVCLHLIRVLCQLNKLTKQYCGDFVFPLVCLKLRVAQVVIFLCQSFWEFSDQLDLSPCETFILALLTLLWSISKVWLRLLVLCLLETVIVSLRYRSYLLLGSRLRFKPSYNLSEALIVRRGTKFGILFDYLRTTRFVKHLIEQETNWLQISLQCRILVDHFDRFL